MITMYIIIYFVSVTVEFLLSYSESKSAGLPGGFSFLRGERGVCALNGKTKV